MILKGKFKVFNNYWMDMGDGTWTSYDTIYVIITHDFGVYTMTYIHPVETVNYVSKDAGQTYEQTDSVIYDENYIINDPRMNVKNIEKAIHHHINDYEERKEIIWLEPLTEVAA